MPEPDVEEINLAKLPAPVRTRLTSLMTRFTVAVCDEEQLLIRLALLVEMRRLGDEGFRFLAPR